ncbi:MAG: hypothetical protein AB7K71_38570 [Polyangiaceae bacterium]
MGATQVDDELAQDVLAAEPGVALLGAQELPELTLSRRGVAAVLCCALEQQVVASELIACGNVHVTDHLLE